MPPRKRRKCVAQACGRCFFSEAKSEATQSVRAAMALWLKVCDGLRSFAELTLGHGSRNTTGAVNLALKVEKAWVVSLGRHAGLDIFLDRCNSLREFSRRLNACEARIVNVHVRQRSTQGETGTILLARVSTGTLAPWMTWPSCAIKAWERNKLQEESKRSELSKYNWPGCKDATVNEINCSQGAIVGISNALRLQAHEFSAAYLEREDVAWRQIADHEPPAENISSGGSDTRPLAKTSSPQILSHIVQYVEKKNDAASKNLASAVANRELLLFGRLLDREDTSKLCAPENSRSPSSSTHSTSLGIKNSLSTQSVELALVPVLVKEKFHKKNFIKNISHCVLGSPIDLMIESHTHKQEQEHQFKEMVFRPFHIFAENERLPKFFHYPADVKSVDEFDLGLDSYVAQSPCKIRGVLCGRSVKYSAYKRHWIRIPRALAILQDELHFLFNCSVKLPLYWADDIMVSSDWRKYST